MSTRVLSVEVAIVLAVIRDLHILCRIQCIYFVLNLKINIERDGYVINEDLLAGAPTICDIFVRLYSFL